MNDPRDEVPGRVAAIRICASLAPVFGVAREREEGGWELCPHFSGFTPQDARDSMGPVFRGLAREAAQSGHRAAYEECMQAASRIDGEPVDELAVLGTRYRVVRAERFIRTGPAGPEPPRPADPDPGEPGRAHEVPDPAAGFVIDPVTATGMSEGILKVELLSCAYPEGAVPAQVRGDSVRAGQAHPGGVLLPATFMTAEKAEGRWVPEGPQTSAAPQAARDSLALYLRVMAPWKLSLGPGEAAVYAAAADRLDAERSDEMEVAGRRFRVVRVERLVRIGPDGPEGPRPSDPDPQPPVMMQAQQLRGEGLLTDQDDDAPIELDEHAKKFAQLFHQEEERRRKRLGKH